MMEIFLLTDAKFVLKLVTLYPDKVVVLLEAHHQVFLHILILLQNT